ncbi:TPA: hypothetical protein ACF3BE_001530 [Klebsiella pneumoniae]|nr:hypothetical protein [Klebsiella pneumoniae]
MKTNEPIPTLALDDLLHMAASAIEDLLEHTDPNTSYYSGAWADVPGKLRAAAMLQSGNSPVVPDERAAFNAWNNDVDCPLAGRDAKSAAWLAWQSRAAMLKAQPQNTPQSIPEIIPDCWCSTCRPVVLNDMRFVVCPDCGNKRCPRANDHRNACTGSNDPGQEGSAYPDTPREVK